MADDLPRQVLELRAVSKRYGDETVIETLDLGICDARTTVLLGQSGSGKSTLLRLMIGLLWPESGEVRFEGERLSPETILQARLRMGYVIQEGGLFPHLNARDNVTLMARHLRWDAARIDRRVDELAALVRLPVSLLGRFPAELSGGQRQRVGLMRALMLDPDVLLLDEPLGALDPMIRAELQRDLQEVFASLGKTVVLVTHDLREAAFLGHEVVLIERGRIVQRGPMEALLAAPAEPFVEQFIGAQRDPLAGLER